ncbi:MAG TPA: hypothetical protein VFF84_02400 [Sphingobium sp.]|nr:hypothetical protein [Sphingobium sp.]
MRDQFDADPDRDLSNFYRRERLVIHLIERAARATAEPEGEESTRITPDDLVNIAAEFVPIDDREDAEWTAEQALRDYHVGWREPTPEKDREIGEADAEMDRWLAEQTNCPDPFDPAQRPVFPSGDPVEEAAFRKSRRRRLHRLRRSSPSPPRSQR